MSLADLDPTASIADRFEAARPALRAYVARLGVPAHDRDDVVQEAMARAWRSRHSFDTSRPLTPWLATTALRVWIDQRSRRSRLQVVDADLHPLPDPRRDRRDEQMDLEGLLLRLSAAERELLLAFHREGLSIAELAVRHQMKPNTVKSHLHRARRKLSAMEDR